MIDQSVIGLGFGDEGKGSVVNHLCQKNDVKLVVRYNGGQQAGHNVALPDGRSHVFSNFGSGSFQNVPTYWSKHCTIDPVGIYNEYQILKEKGVTPKLFIDVDCPVTTPYDKYMNQYDIYNRQHGSCGTGFGKTLKREEAFYSLLAGDILYKNVFDIKQQEIQKYYQNKIFDGVGLKRPYNYDYETHHREFINAIDFILDCPDIEFRQGLPTYIVDYPYVFEGAQGLLLDQHYGFFPHVTPSNVGYENIKEICRMKRLLPEMTVVTRAFQTRHGNGPMTNTKIEHKITLDKDETNVNNEYQGEFRHSLLDADLLKYAIHRTKRIPDNLMVTCLDLVKEDGFRFTKDDKIYEHKNEVEFCKKLAQELGIRNVFMSNSKLGIFEEL